MGKKRKTLPKEIGGLLESGNIEVIKKQLSRCEPNALTSVKYGSNIFSLSPLPREIALWAKEQGDYYNKTPIFSQAAAWQGDVQLLIDLGARVDVADDFGVTPLHLAALYGRLDAVRALLDAGVDVNVKSGQHDGRYGYQTPLEKTLAQDRLPYQELLAMCTLLLDRGAEITGRCREYLRRSAEQFQRNKRGIKDPAFLRSQTESLEKLYRLFDVPPAGDAGRIDDFLCKALCACAVAWVQQNPEPLPPLEADYKR